MKSGKLSAEEAETHPQRSVITRALGTDPDVDVDTFTLQARAGDVFLLCSDGLSTMVDAETIARLVEQHRHDLRAAARALIKEANDRGGDDNITSVLFEVAEGEPEDETVEAAGADDEDTLHPEDTLPGAADGDTAILTVEQIRSALATEAEEPRAPLWRLFLSALVIVALAGVVVLLVLHGLAR